MFWLLDEHHVLPGDYYRRPEGEKVAIREFYNYTMRERQGQWNNRR